MRSSEATAFVKSEWTFAGFQSFGKLRQKRLRTVLRFSVWFRKLFFFFFLMIMVDRTMYGAGWGHEPTR
jgi:hypothetical protein